MIYVKFILLIFINLFTITTKSYANYAVILIYHKFDESNSPSTSIPIKVFDKQMKYLKEQKYNVVSLKTLYKYIKKGRIPPKTVAITIDDGYKSTMKAFKILKKYNFPFTVFLYMEAVGRYPDFLSKEQIEILKKYPKIEFGNHSYTHKRLAKFPKGLTQKEYKELLIKDTKRAECRFKKLVGYTPQFYAYPYGEYNEIFVQAIKEAKYKAAFTQDPYSVGSFSDFYLIPRQPIVGKWASMDHFKKILNTPPLNIKPINPKIGFLKQNPPGKFKAKLKNPDIYTNCKLYISEIGWLDLKKKGSILISDPIPYLKRWKNRVGVKCKNKNTDRYENYFYMILKKE